MEHEDVEEVIAAVIDALKSEAHVLNIQNGPFLTRCAITEGWGLIERKVREQVAREIREYASGLDPLGKARVFYLKAADLVHYEPENDDG